MIRELLRGTYEIHNSQSKPSFNQIKTMVASKGGVTEAALKKIESSGMEEIWKLAIDDAINQSKNLGDK
jgi:pyrroline-5-carboxylate reductase